MATIINISDRLKANKGEKMFTLSFYNKDGKWAVDVDDISMLYEHVDTSVILEDIHIGVKEIEKHLRKNSKEK